MQANFCVSRIDQWPICKLLPYTHNARVHSEAQIARIAASIAACEDHGTVAPGSSFGGPGIAPISVIALNRVAFRRLPIYLLFAAWLIVSL